MKKLIIIVFSIAVLFHCCESRKAKRDALLDKYSKSKNLSPSNQEVRGRWISDNSLLGARMTLYTKNADSLILSIYYKDGSTSNVLVIESIEDNKKRYDTHNNHSEFYIIEPNGNLGMYNREGKFDEATKL